MAMASLHPTYDDEDDEEETVELRVSASRQDRRDSADKRATLRKMSSSTSPHIPQVNDGEEGKADENQPMPSRRASAGGLLDFTKSVLASATSHRPYGNDDAIDLAEATNLLHEAPTYKSAWSQKQETYDLEQSRADTAKETQVRLKLLAFWQLLLTGFEVLKFSIGKRAKKYVLWLALDGTMYLGSSKSDKATARSLFLADVYRIQKGNSSQVFSKSQSWRDARGKDNLTFSIHGRFGKEDRVFAIQVWKPNVRNVLVENFENLLRLMKSDADGEFPYVAQRVIAEQYAMTGEVLTLRQVEDVLLREEDEKKPREIGGDRDHRDGDGGSSDDSDLSEEEEDQRDILG